MLYILQKKYLFFCEDLFFLVLQTLQTMMKCRTMQHFICVSTICQSTRLGDSDIQRVNEPHKRHCVVVLEQDTCILALYWFNPGRPV